jgi:LysR family transcriptional regulator, glycine cleavage system transcriptional activator
MTMRVPRQALLDALRAFSVAARQLSFKAAAETLFLTPSAISHRIRDLEEHLGQAVFVRKTRAIELTDAGRALLDEIDPLLQSLDAALDRAGKRTRRRVLRIAAPPFIATDLLLPNLESFYGMQRRIDVDISSGTARPSAHSPQADVSIVIAPEPPADMIAIKLLTPRFVAAASQPIALVAKELGPALFEKLRRIVYRHRSDLWTQWFAMSDVPARRSGSIIQVDTFPASIAAAERGLGVALVPTFVCQRRLRPGRVQRISDIEVESGDTYFLVYRREDRSRPEVRAFVSWALAELRR